MKILFVGFGNVAKEMCRIFNDMESYPKLAASGFAPQVVGIYTARHGGVSNIFGLDLKRTLDDLQRTGNFECDKSDLSPLEACKKLDYDVLIELSSLAIEAKGEPAISHIKAALSRGISAVTANKGPVSFAYDELCALAAERGAKFLFESSVMDGAPVFNFVNRCMKGATVTGFSGILNGTTNFILSFMEEGGSLEEGIKKAQAAGIAEANPYYDVDGWDAAAKTAALANVLMGAKTNPYEVDRSGIGGITPKAAQEAVKDGKRLKLICRGGYDCEGKIIAKVAVEAISKDDIFSKISHFGAAIKIESDLMHPNIIVQESPDLLDTAFGVIEDCLSLRD